VIYDAKSWKIFLVKNVKGGDCMSKRVWTFFCLIVFLSFSLSGCYYFSAKKEIANAEKSFSELKGSGGEKLAPYEYCSAEKFLEASKVEFADGDYKPAKGFAERSKSASEAGLAAVKKK
jgi:hypothetical protein